LVLKLADRCAGIEVLVLDVDGVLTEGGIVHDDRGCELKVFHVRDGTAIKAWRESGKDVVLISGRCSEAVATRARELGIQHLYQGAPDKAVVLEGFLERAGIERKRACAVGDDIADLPLVTGCGLGIAVADACAEVRAAAHYICRLPGGKGAVREAIELIRRCRGEAL
jgi:3-deoxy-D-manno-octulosonate 8-phosphate phosphatase (KDO 8-P phosphatase)